MEIILSSAKRGYGLDELLSQEEGEYWATNNVPPHCIRISFSRLVYLYSICLKFSFVSDQSYTPEHIVVYTERGTRKFTWKEPMGYKEMRVNERLSEVHAVIMGNHSDGRDSHVRGIKLLSAPGTEYNLDEYLIR